MSDGYANLLSTTAKADADLSAKQRYLVKATASNGCNLAGANDRVFGVLTNKPASGKGAEIQVAGIAKVIVGGVVARGDYLKSDVNGKAVKQTGEAAGTLVEVFGIALEASTADLDVITCLLTRVVVNNALT